MERKTKHRILGIFVVIGFVIIMLPFFQGSREAQSDATLVKPPAFPDQAVQVNAPADQAPAAPISEPITQQPQPLSGPVNEQPDDTISNKAAVNAEAPDMSKPSTTPSAETPAPEKQQPATKNKISDVTTTTPETNKVDDVSTSDTTAKTAELSTLTPTQDSKADDIAQMSDEVTAPETATDNDAKAAVVSEKADRNVSAEKFEPKHEKIAHASKKMAKITKHSRNPKVVAAYKRLPIENDGLFKLKNAVWVIQIGSFKNKTNALRLVNQLRANGYRAFIQQFSSSLGDNTRVFIGPENKQANARALANQVEADMHMHGIVISYKPLTL